MAFCQRQLAQIVDQPDQVAGLPVQVGDVRFVQRIHVVHRGAEVAL